MDWENVHGASARVTLIHSHFYFYSRINLSWIGIGFSILDWENVRGASARDVGEQIFCYSDQSITDWD